MDKRQKQETLILKLLKHSPEQASWLDPDQMDQAKLDEYQLPPTKVGGLSLI